MRSGGVDAATELIAKRGDESIPAANDVHRPPRITRTSMRKPDEARPRGSLVPGRRLMVD